MQPSTTSLSDASATRIYLIGMMGSGKSTIGRRLAQQLSHTWIEIDACVERHTGLPIAEIFSSHDENTFRLAEWGCVRQTLAMRDIVISCGGGTPCFYNAIDLLLTSGIVIYLKTSAETLQLRVQEDGEIRPLLEASNASTSNIIQTLLSHRDPIYSRAHHIVDTDGLTPGEVVMKILERLSQHHA